MQKDKLLTKPEDSKLLTVAQLAIRFGVSKVAIYQMLLNNSIPHIKVDRIPYFSVDQIVAWQRELMKDRHIERSVR